MLQCKSEFGVFANTPTTWCIRDYTGVSPNMYFKFITNLYYVNLLRNFSLWVILIDVNIGVIETNLPTYFVIYVYS